MDKVPNKEEIEEVIKSFKPRKSPGLDGPIVEVLRACWEWVGGLYLEVIFAFWRDGILTPGVVRGIIKLIPKEGMMLF